MSNKNISPARDLVTIVWGHRWEAIKGFCGYEYENVLNEAVSLAIKTGLHFDREDFKLFQTKLVNGRGYYREDPFSQGDGESFYAAAVACRNISACQSIEEWLGRKPFIYTNGKRLHVDSEFGWNGEAVTCTSFAKDGSHLVACSYVFPNRYDEKGKYVGLKVKHVYKITREDILNARRKLKEADKAAESKGLETAVA